MKYLLDTCIVSEMHRFGGSSPAAALIRETREEDLFLSVLTIGELRRGVEALPKSKQRASLESWLAELKNQFSDRLLSVDEQVSERWGSITAAARKRGRAIPPVDGLIAASALCHGLTIVTRNVDDFVESGVAILNPWG